MMTVMNVRWGLLGVPSSAGAHTPGLEKGPAAIRAAGLVELLPGGAEDHGDVMAFRWRPDHERPDGKHAAVVAEVAEQTASGVARILEAGQTPVVVGGDCSITVGVVAGFVRSGVRPALLYVDGGSDLYTPETRRSVECRDGRADERVAGGAPRGALRPVGRAGGTGPGPGRRMRDLEGLAGRRIRRPRQPGDQVGERPGVGVPSRRALRRRGPRGGGPAQGRRSPDGRGVEGPTGLGMALDRGGAARP